MEATKKIILKGTVRPDLNGMKWYHWTAPSWLGHWPTRHDFFNQPTVAGQAFEQLNLKVHKNENFFGFDFEFCTISLLVMSKY